MTLLELAVGWMVLMVIVNLLIKGGKKLKAKL